MYMQTFVFCGRDRDARSQCAPREQRPLHGLSFYIAYTYQPAYSPQARLSFLAHCLDPWMTAMVERKDHESRLLPYVLGFLHDDDPSIATCEPIDPCATVLALLCQRNR